MTITFVNISTYVVFAYGGPEGNSGVEATISLGIPDAYAFLRFFPEGVQVPANKKTTHVSGRPIFYVNYRYAQFSNVVDLLRNEEPIKFFFRDDSLAAYITTSSEPVGEGES